MMILKQCDQPMTLVERRIVSGLELTRDVGGSLSRNSLIAFQSAQRSPRRLGSPECPGPKCRQPFRDAVNPIARLA